MFETLRYKFWRSAVLMTVVVLVSGCAVEFSSKELGGSAKLEPPSKVEVE